ncbi:MAG TPA: nucleotidyltransferase family protein [Nitrosomonas sp.]|nr:nucleotidyltransferase family protein [Nitrosomonas sp.]
MILAAGQGKRMRPLTDNLPKPLLKAGKHALIEYQIFNLARAGFMDIVINHAYLGTMIEEALGNGDQYGVRIHYSPETLVLETAGGIVNAMHLLTNPQQTMPFLVVNGDIYCEFDYAPLRATLDTMQTQAKQRLAHLILVDNPAHHPEGDFFLQHEYVTSVGTKKLTFSGIGLYQSQIFHTVAPGEAAKLAPLLRQAMQNNQVTGEYFSGRWIDVGTPERLQQLDNHLKVQAQS